jgi:hypothetical protein
VLLSLNWDNNIEKGVCHDATRYIANCPVSFTFSPLNAALLTGAKLTVSADAKDASGSPTAYPVGAKFSTTTPDVISVHPDTGVIDALAPGNAVVELEETTTGAKGRYVLVVTDGIVSPQNPTIGIGESVQLTLVAPGGQDLFTGGVQITWRTGAQELTRIQVTQSPLVNWSVVKGLSAGSAVLAAYNPVSGVDKTTTITVQDAPTALAVFPLAARVDVGSSVTYRAFRVDASGTYSAAPADIQWQPGNAAVASVNATGRASGLALGSTTVTATSPASTRSAQAKIVVEDGNNPYPGPQETPPSTGQIPSDLVFVRSASDGGGGDARGPVVWAGGPPSLDGFQVQEIQRKDPNAPGAYYYTIREFWWCRATNSACFQWAAGATSPP